MKKFSTVLMFELSNYIKSKSYAVTTALIALLIAVIMFLPRFIDMSDFLGTSDDTTQSADGTGTDESSKDSDDVEKVNYIIYDQAKVFESLEPLKTSFAGSEWSTADSAKEVQEQVKSQNVEAGFVVKSATEYEYYVYNKSLSDMDMSIFNELMAQSYRNSYCDEHNLDIKEVMQLVNVDVTGEEQVLGKDMGKSYAYCYILVIAIFMIIVLYCIMIATSVTNEKSNRSIEVLVTSTTPNSLIFGKVVAGTIASFVQVALILAAALGGYALNRDYWGGMLDNVLDIPANVLTVFFLFAIAGFVFYAFIYAAVGALCSKTEDLNKSASGVQMVIMIVYFIVLFQMSNIDGAAMKVLSFLPVSSYSAMYIRVAMGEVATWEIIVSFIILVVSIFGIGWIAAKIYRMGTLRYGNPISIRSALKSLKDKSAE